MSINTQTPPELNGNQQGMDGEQIGFLGRIVNRLKGMPVGMPGHVQPGIRKDRQLATEFQKINEAQKTAPPVALRLERPSVTPEQPINAGVARAEQPAAAPEQPPVRAVEQAPQQIPPQAEPGGDIRHAA